MRPFTSVMFLILPFLFLAQNRRITITGTKQDWAGGISYRSGTNYTLWLQSDETDLQNAVIECISVDGNCLSSGWHINANPNGLTFTFGTSYDAYREGFKKQTGQETQRPPMSR